MRTRKHAVTNTVADRREAKAMLASMSGEPGSKPFKGRLIYGAKTIKELRKRLEITQVGLAQLLSTDVGTVQSWEQGRRVPDATKMKVLVMLQQHPKQLMAWMKDADKVLQPA